MERFAGVNTALFSNIEDDLPIDWQGTAGRDTFESCITSTSTCGFYSARDGSRFNVAN